jgi:hypothetical protein
LRPIRKVCGWFVRSAGRPDRIESFRVADGLNAVNGQICGECGEYVARRVRTKHRLTRGASAATPETQGYLDSRAASSRLLPQCARSHTWRIFERRSNHSERQWH